MHCQRWGLIAPQYGKMGSNNYFIDETGVIRMIQDDLLATAQDPALE